MTHPPHPHNDLHEAILDAVDRLLGRYGFQKMTMDDLAREAGVAKRTIYLHFANKEDVALSSIDRVVDRLLERLREIAAASGDPGARLREAVVTRILFRFDAVREYYQSFNDLFAAIRPAYLARRERYFRAEAGVLAKIVREGIDTGIFAEGDPEGDFEGKSGGDPETIAQTILLATNALLPYSLSPRELGTREEVETRVARIADLMLSGLLARVEGPVGGPTHGIG